MAQLALVWRRLYDNQSALPSLVGELIIYEPSRLSGMIDVSLCNIESTEYDMTFDVLLSDCNGIALVKATGMKCTCSSALNRLNLEWRNILDEKGLTHCTSSLL